MKHGFFTRKGGASSGIFAGLNCGLGSSDQREVVLLNRQRVAEALDVDQVVSVYQTHSPDVVVVAAPGDTEGAKADAMVSNTKGIALGVLTADCQPVLFADHEAGVIGAAHAGWKGALGGVLEATLDGMEALGARRGRTVAVIGPAISQAAYEVGPEFLDGFLTQDDASTRFFANGTDDRYHFDLIGYSLDRLRRTGIGEVVWTGHCTYSNPDMFYSYRRSCHEAAVDYGRLISAIAL